MSIPEVFDEDGTLYDFINGPKGYDVTHLGASEGAIIALNSNNDINTNITDTAVKIVAETGPTDTNTSSTTNIVETEATLRIDVSG